MVTMENSFHGRTFATISATAQEKVKQGFSPLLPGFVHVPFNDLDAVEKVMGPKTAAVLLEPVQGEGGVHVADSTFLKGVRELCRQRGVLLIFDEVQSGMGRTGTLFAYEQLGVTPDIMTLAKGLGGGLPIGACLATEEVSAGFVPGSHASTFGGNPLACAAALAVMRALVQDGVLEKGRRMGESLAKGLKECQAGLPHVIKEVRGLGLLQGMELTDSGASVVTECLHRGILINCTMERVLRFLPPLIITQAQIDRLLDLLHQLLSKRN